MLKPLRKKILAALFLGFVILFILRFLFSFFIQEDKKNSNIAVTPYGIFESTSKIRYDKRLMSNVAQISDPSVNFLDAGPVDMLQVFEQEATMKSVSENFKQDEEQIRNITKNLKATIRYQKNGGLKPRRFLNFVISVAPQNFDTLVAKLRTVAQLSEINITKEDKTQDFRNLYSKRESLLDYKKSLEKLRKYTGKVEEFITLEEKIQGIEREIQSLGVQLGGFIEKESYSNVSFSLAEIQKTIISKDDYPIASRIVNAFIWSMKWYFLFIIVVGFIYLTFYSIKLLRE